MYYFFYPLIWLYKRYFGYSAATTDGIAFEYTCANILRGRGFSNVQVTQASGDQGIDVLASKGGSRYAIQCKLYSNPVGNSAVQEAYAGMGYYGCTNAAVMTNSTFTKSARDLANSLGVELWDNTPTSSKRERNPWVFWISLIAMLAFEFYSIEVEEKGGKSIDPNGIAIIIWIGFILLYVFVFPAIKRFIKRSRLKKEIKDGLKEINEQLDDIEAEINRINDNNNYDDFDDGSSIKYDFNADEIADDSMCKNDRILE